MEKTKPLFPVLNQTDTSRQVFNFNCSVSSKNCDFLDNHDTEKLSWLENSSFKPSLLDKQDDRSHNLSSVREQKVPASGNLAECTILTSSDSESYEVERKKRIKKKKHKHKVKKHKRARSRSPPTQIDNQSSLISDQLQVPAALQNKVFVEEIPGLEAEHAYRVDRTADKNIVTYGSLYKLHIAKYKPNTNASLTPSINLIDSCKQKKTSKNDKHRYFDGENKRCCRSLAQKCTAKFRDELMDDFINLNAESEAKSSSHIHKQTDWHAKSSVDVRKCVMDSATLSYVEGKGPPETESNVELEKSDLWLQSEKYNRILREQPNNVQMWLDFVQFQDRFIYEDINEQSTSITSNISKVPRQVILEKKMLILKKAMDANPACIKLKIVYLDICQSMMELDKVAEEFERLLFVYPANMDLWKQYLTFSQSRLSTFSVSQVSKLYHKSFKKLLCYLDGQLHTHCSLDGLSKNMLELFLQYCYFLKQTGHTEKAIASFQAMLEFNMYCPDQLKNIPHSDRCNVFESFWDSGVPRIGEKGSKGWKYWIENKEDSTTFAPNSKQIYLEDAEQKFLLGESPKWKVWLDIELLRESAHWFPWRPDLSKDETEEDCEDVECLVLYDDIAPVLFSLPRELHLELFIHFLMFLGVDLSEKFVILSSSVSERGFSLTNITEVHSSDTCCVNDAKILPAVKVFVDDLLQQVIQYTSGATQTFLTEMLLWLQTSSKLQTPLDLKQVKKFAKNLLKEPRNRSNMYVWAEYGCQLWRCDNSKEALSVLETALCMFTKSNNDDSLTKYGLTHLFRLYVEILLAFPPKNQNSIVTRKTPISADVFDKAQQALMCMVEESPFSERSKGLHGSTVYLKLKKTLHKKLELVISKLRKMADTLTNDSAYFLRYVCDLVMCCALLLWSFTQQIDNCVDLIQSTATTVKHTLTQQSGTFQQPALTRLLEELHCCKLRLICHHMNSLSCPLGVFRTAIMSALEDIPHSQYILRLFVQSELRTHISGRLDRFFTHALRYEVTPITLAYAVLSQLQRLQHVDENSQTEVDIITDLSGTTGQMPGAIHKMRSYLEKGLEKGETRICPFLWKLFLYIEMKYGTVERAKGIFYRSLQVCPWAKMLYVQGIAAFGDDKLNDITDLLMEKELRLQLPMEELDLLLVTDQA